MLAVKHPEKTLTYEIHAQKLDSAIKSLQGSLDAERRLRKDLNSNLLQTLKNEIAGKVKQIKKEAETAKA